MKEKWR